MVVKEGDPEHPKVIHTEIKRGALYTCSYEEEVAAMRIAMNWIATHRDSKENITICTDSQSLCMALISHNTETDDIRAPVTNLEGHITIQWIPGHSGIPGNDMADSEAKKATDLNEPPRDVTLRSAHVMIKKTFQDEIKHQRIKTVYSKIDKEVERTINDRKDQVTLAQIRSGKHMAFQAYRHQVDSDTPGNYPRCGEDNHTLEHWFLHCPATLRAKQDLFRGEEDTGLYLLSKHPIKLLTLARRTLLRVGKKSHQ